jgi:hypothetical protein
MAYQLIPYRSLELTREISVRASEDIDPNEAEYRSK